MVRRAKHEAQLERWARQALRGSLLAGAIAVMMTLSGGPRKVAADGDGETTAGGAQTLGNLAVNNVILQQIQTQLAAKVCAKCGGGKMCCCGDPANCKCGAATQSSCDMGK